MQIAQDLAGYTLGEADLLRRAMGKKIKKRDGRAARALRHRRGRARHRARRQAEAIFELLAKFADYGFNKSARGAPTRWSTYQTAYMKANYPVEFLAASMTYDMANTDKLSEFRAEARGSASRSSRRRSTARARISTSKETRSITALAALKGVGREAVKAIVEARGDKPFRDLTDFAGRVNPRAINKRVLESLSAAGAFDALERQPGARPCAAST